MKISDYGDLTVHGFATDVIRALYEMVPRYRTIRLSSDFADYDPWCGGVSITYASEWFPRLRDWWSLS